MVSIRTRPHRPRIVDFVATLSLALSVVACGTGAAVPAPGVAQAPAVDETQDPTMGAVLVTSTTDPPAAADASVPLVTDSASTSTADPTTAAPTTTAPTTSVPTTSAPPPEKPAKPSPSTSAVATGWAAFDQDLMRILADDVSSAVSATVLDDGEVVHEVALGSRTSAGDPVEVGDRYRVASISKVITSITILRLVQQGLIGLDDPVGDRLAARLEVDVPAAGVSEITVRRLLSHRSGIGQYENLMFARQVESCPEAGAVALGRPLQRAPGTTFDYSNVNFCLLGQLIEDITGREYADVVGEQLLEPLGITGMRLAGTFDVGDGDVEHATVADRNYMEVLEGAGSWIASPTDIAMIIDSLDLTTPGWKPLGPALNDEMKTITTDPPIAPDPDLTPPTASTVPPPPTTGYGLGLMIFGPDSFGHTGTLESTHAMTVRQADGLTWAITVSGDAPSSSRDLARIVGEALTAGGLG